MLNHCAWDILCASTKNSATATNCPQLDDGEIESVSNWIAEHSPRPKLFFHLKCSKCFSSRCIFFSSYRGKCAPILVLQGLLEWIARTAVTATMELCATMSVDSATVYQGFKEKRYICLISIKNSFFGRRLEKKETTNFYRIIDLYIR